MTQSPTLWNGILYVGASSQEELAAALIPNYNCCSFIGNFATVTLDGAFQSLIILWSQEMAPADSGFKGIGVWGSQPSIDVDRQQVFIATGNAYALPPSAEACQKATQNATGVQRDPCTPNNVYSEAIMAFDLTTGLINWVAQLGPLEAWNVACPLPSLNPGNCPPIPGVDADFGMAPTFVPGSATTPHGIDVVITGQKNGNLYALSAQAGTIMWALATSPGGNKGGLSWGVAVDDRSVYFTAINNGAIPWRLKGGSTNITNSAYGAVSLSSGAVLWETQAPDGQISEQQGPTVVNDVMFVGRTGSSPSGVTAGTEGSGGLIVLNKYSGAILNDYSLNNVFFGGVAVVDNLVMFGEGYGGASGNGSFSVWRVD